MVSLPLDTARSAAQISSAGEDVRPDGMTAHHWCQSLTHSFFNEWQELETDCSEPNPFFESWALPPALKAFDINGKVKLIQFRAAGKLRGLMPLYEPQSYYGYPIPYFRNWLHDNVFCGAPLVTAGFEERFWHGLHEWGTQNSTAAPFLHLSHLPESGLLFEGLKNVLEHNGITAAIVHREKRAILQSRQSPEDYFTASMSGKKRKELRRQHNRLSDLGKVTFERRTDCSALSDWIDQFLALEAAGWKGREGSALASDLGTETLFRQSLQGAAKAGKLERLMLALDGRPIAMLVNYLTPPTAFSFKTTFDEQYARFSPGVLLQRENLSLLARPDIEWADSCASADHPMIERIWRQKRSIVKVNIGIGGPLRQAAFRQMLRFESNSELIGK